MAAHVGFTGTRQGMTERQKTTLRAILGIYKAESDGILYFHHGDCIGADAEAHTIAAELGYRIVVHPCILVEQRAYCTDGVYAVRQSKPALNRNMDIVDASDILLACPKANKEELRSGTWMTVRYARKTAKHHVVIDPYD